MNITPIRAFGSTTPRPSAMGEAFDRRANRFEISGLPTRDHRKSDYCGRQGGERDLARLYEQALKAFASTICRCRLLA